VLRGSHKKHSTEFKELVKLRGTELQIQQEIRECPIFYEFVEDIVKDIESKNLHTIAITCRAGHHRSVACAEMFVHLYENRTVDHLTIK
jgi:RNase adaptor protein for sRNA GlmZ degradation